MHFAAYRGYLYSLAPDSLLHLQRQQYKTQKKFQKCSFSELCLDLSPSSVSGVLFHSIQLNIHCLQKNQKVILLYLYMSEIFFLFHKWKLHSSRFSIFFDYFFFLLDINIFVTDPLEYFLFSINNPFIILIQPFQ